MLKNQGLQNQKGSEKKDQKPPINPSKRKRRRKIIIYTFSIIAFLALIVFPILLNIFADRIIGRTLSEIVRYETKGNYKLRFADVGLNVFSREISFDSLLLARDTAFVKIDSIPDNFEIALAVPKIHLKGASWLKAIFSGELIIDDFFIENPHIDISLAALQKDTSLVRPANDTLEISINESFSYIHHYLNLLEVNNFMFNKGMVDIRIRHKTGIDTLEIRNFSLAFNNFHLDSLAHLKTEKLFFSDSLGLNIHDGYFNYRTANHEVLFGHLDVSSAHGNIIIRDLKIEQDSSRFLNDSLGWFLVNVDEVELTGLDYYKMIESNTLFLNQIEISYPEITYKPKSKKPDENSNDEDIRKKIYNSFTDYFEPVDIGTIKLMHGKLVFPRKATAGIKNLIIPDFNITFQHLLMDSSSFDRRKKFFFIDDFIFESNMQQLDFDKSSMDVAYENLLLSTAENSIRFKNLKVSDNESPGQDKYDFEIPEFKILSNNLKHDFLDHSLDLKLVELKNAKVNIQIDSKSQELNSPDIYNLYPQIKSFLKWIEIDKLKIVGANVGFLQGNPKKNKLKIDGVFDVDFNNFSIDSNSWKKDEIFYAEHITSNVRNLTVELPKTKQKLSSESLLLDTRASSVTIEHFQLDTLFRSSKFRQKQANTLLVKIAQVGFAGVDFKSLYRNKGYFVDGVMVQKSEIVIIKNQLVNHDPEFRKQAINYRVGELAFEGGSLLMVEQNKLDTNFSVRNFNLSLRELLPSNDPSGRIAEADKLEATLEGVHYVFPGQSHDLRLGIFHISSIDSLIGVSNLNLNTTTTPGNESTAIIHFSLPELTIRSIPVFDFYHDRKLKSKHIKLENPELVYRNSTVIQGKTGSFHDFDPDIIKIELLKPLSMVAIDSFEISGGQFEILQGKDYETGNITKIGGLNLSISNFDIDSTTRMSASNVLFAESIHLKIDSVFNNTPVKKESIFAKNIDIATSDNSFFADDLEIVFYQKNPQPEKSKLDLGQISLEGIDYYKLISEKKIDFDKLEIDKPDLLFTRFVPGKKAQAGNRKLFDAYQLLSKHFNELKANEVKIDKAKLKVRDKVSGKSRVYLFEKFDIEMKHILIDSSKRIFKNKFLYSDDVSFDIHNFTEVTPDSLYTFGASCINFSSKNATLNVDSGYYKPNFIDTVFAARVGVQTDRFDLAFTSLNFSNIRLLDFITDNTLWIDKVELEGLFGNDYRNKKYPMPENHSPKLPATALQALDFDLMVDTLSVKNSHFAYREFQPPALENGTIWFSEIYLEGRNITNNPGLFNSDTLMRVNANALMMDKGSLTLNLAFDVKNENDYFRADGKLKSMDMTLLNPMLENVAFVKVTNGINEMLSFEFMADTALATGDMQFEYSKLHIRLINKKDLSSTGLGESLASFIANTFVVRRNNPKFPFRTRQGGIYFRRDTTKSFFNYITKSTLSGVKETIRGGNEKRKEERQKSEALRQLMREGSLTRKMMRELNREQKRRD